MPFPATRKASPVVRKRGKTAILKSSPYKKELEETIKKKEVGKRRKAKEKSNKRSNKNRKKYCV